MSQLSSEYIVRMVARLAHDTIATELAEHGSLLDLQDALEFEGKAISSEHITTMVLQVQLALNEVWNLGYVHDDVAERNVLVFRYGEDPAHTGQAGRPGEAHFQNVQSDVEKLLQMNLRPRKEGGACASTRAKAASSANSANSPADELRKLVWCKSSASRDACSGVKACRVDLQTSVP